MFNANNVNDSDAYYVDYTEELIESDTFAYALHVMKTHRRLTNSHHKLDDVLAQLQRDGKLSTEGL
jgi:hypothetical protein